MDKKIKILFTIPNFDTAGSGKVVYDLVNGLDRSKFSPEICCFHNRGEFFMEVEKLGVTIHLFPFTAEYRPFATFPLRVLKIYKFFKTHKFDIIHSWHWSSDFSEALAARFSGAYYLYTKKAMGWGNKAWTWRSKLSRKIITINEDMLQEYYLDMKHKVDEIPLGIDTNVFKPLVKSYKSPENITVNENEFVIVSIANLVAVKGIELLLEAVLKLNDARIKVFIVGDYENDYGIPLKTKYETSDSIIFTGKKLDVKPYLALADVFVIPTKNEGRREGLPIAPIEAMSCSRIVLGSNIVGIKDVLKQFPECIFEPSDIEGIADKILYIKNMSLSEKKTLETKMRTYVEENLSLQQFLEAHENLYLNIYRNV